MSWLVIIFWVALIILIICCIIFKTKKNVYRLPKSIVSQAKEKFGNKIASPSKGITPKKLIITYKTKESIPESRIASWKKLNPSVEIILFGNAECKQYLEETYSPIHSKNFDSIRDGPIKADYFRIHYLLKEGGAYVDADAVPLTDIKKYIDDGRFITAMSMYSDKDYSLCNPMFICVPPNSPVCKIGVFIYELLFREKIKYAYRAYSIVRVISQIIVLYPNLVNLELHEKKKGDMHDVALYDRETNTKVMMNRGRDYSRENHSFS
jgi:Glycosyltransferase sugar-binding region containing DXD motif